MVGFPGFQPRDPRAAREPGVGREVQNGGVIETKTEQAETVK